MIDTIRYRPYDAGHWSRCSRCPGRERTRRCGRPLTTRGRVTTSSSIHSASRTRLAVSTIVSASLDGTRDQDRLPRRGCWWTPVGRGLLSRTTAPPTSTVRAATVAGVSHGSRRRASIAEPVRRGAWAFRPAPFGRLPAGLTPEGSMDTASSVTAVSPTRHAVQVTTDPHGTLRTSQTFCSGVTSGLVPCHTRRSTTGTSNRPRAECTSSGTSWTVNTSA